MNNPFDDISQSGSHSPLDDFIQSLSSDSHTSDSHHEHNHHPSDALDLSHLNLNLGEVHHPHDLNHVGALDGVDRSHHSLMTPSGALDAAYRESLAEIKTDFYSESHPQGLGSNPTFKRLNRQKAAMRLIKLATIAILALTTTACEQRTLPEKIAGKWKNVEMQGDKTVNNDIEIQLEVNSSGNVIIIAVNKAGHPPTIERLTGRIEGQFIIIQNKKSSNDEELIGKINTVGDRIEITDFKQQNGKLIMTRLSL